MNYCISIEPGLWAFLGLLGVLSGLVMVAVLIAGYGERRERRKADARRRVFVTCATRIGKPLPLPTRRPAANDPTLRS